MRLLLAAPLALLSACGSHHGAVELPATVGGAVRVTGVSPFAPGCNGAPQPGVEYRGAEVEPWIAVDPGDPQHLVGVWQQDRWSNSGASGLLAAVSRDGGRSWTRSQAAFTRCTGGNPVDGGDYERATDPWVTIATDGTVHQIAFSFDKTTARQAILASRSTDGGLTWSDPLPLQVVDDADVAVDKETITADPTDPRRVYATWDRLTALTDPVPAHVSGPAWLARSLDGGVSWEAARPIYDPGQDAQTIGNLIGVLPDGTLVDLFTRLLNQSTTHATMEVVAIRSIDHGLSWQAPVVVSAFSAVGVVDPKSGAAEPRAVRAGDALPALAVDQASGALWAAWADGRFSANARDGIALSRSADGGLAWSPPIQVNQVRTVQAFTPALAVAPDGTLGVAYLDFRRDSPSEPGHLWTTAWLATTADGGATWQETGLGAPFDLRAAPSVGAWFVGDYLGLVARGGTFTGFFVMTNLGVAGDSTDVFAGGTGTGATAPAAPAEVVEQRVVSPRPLRELLNEARELPGKDRDP